MDILKWNISINKHKTRKWAANNLNLWKHLKFVETDPLTTALKTKCYISAQKRQSLLSRPFSIVSAAFVTDGTWPAGLQLAHSAALKPLGARRKHMGRIPWHHPACTPDTPESPGMRLFHCTCQESLKHNQLF